MVLLGLAAFHKKIDWPPIWLNELGVNGSFGCGTEIYIDALLPTYEIAIKLMSDGKLDSSPLLTHEFKLSGGNCNYI